MRINDVRSMFCVHTLPWYCKAAVVSYDVCRCVLIRRGTSQSAPPVITTTMGVFALQTMLALLLMAPSLCLSVSERVRTNTFCSEMLLLLSLYSLVIWAMRANEVSAANACFLLQFCSCYLFFCYYHAMSTHSCLLLGHRVVRAVSVVCMFLFPVLYSQQQDCMHVSPYVLVFLFAGEVSGCVCACAAQLLVGFECLVDALYVGLQGV